MAIMLVLSENASPLHYDKMAFFNDYLHKESVNFGLGLVIE